MEELKDYEVVKELLETKQYTKLRQFLAEMNDADIAACMEELEDTEMLKVFRILPKDLAADMFSYLEVENQQMIITSLSDKEAANIINNFIGNSRTCFLRIIIAKTKELIIQFFFFYI